MKVSIYKIIAPLFFCILALQCCYAQQENKFEYNVFDHKLKYLDKNYKIVISKKEFDNKVKISQAIPSRIRNFRDSVAIVLFDEFKNYEVYTAAVFQITYTWTRLANHLWQSESYLQKVASLKSIHHPYLFKKFLIEQPLNPLTLEIVSNLKGKMKKANIKIPINISNEQLFSLANRNNLLQNVNVKAEPCKPAATCDKENCCQKKKL